jgi:peptidylprolyl isomerase
MFVYPNSRQKFSFAITMLRIGAAALAICVTVRMAHGAENTPATDGKTVLIHTDAGDVTVADVRANLATLPPLTQVTLQHDQAQLSNMVRLIAAQKLMLKEAIDKGWDQKPDVAASVAAAVDRARTDVILRDYIADETKPPKSYPSDADIRAAYDANKMAFTIPKKYHYAQIFVALPKGADKATEDKASAKLAEIEAKLKELGTDFSTIAAASSDDAMTAKRQGDAGTLAEAQVPAPLRGALTALRPGAVSEPIQTDKGWYILKVIDVSEGRERPLEEVREQLRTGLRNQSAQQDAKARIDAFVEKTPAPDSDALAKLTASPAP